jgi:hypothetical protein
MLATRLVRRSGQAKDIAFTFGSCAGLDNISTRYVMFQYHGQRIYEERGALAEGGPEAQEDFVRKSETWVLRAA